MKIFDVEKRQLLIPENAKDILKILGLEQTVDSINYSSQSTFGDAISLVPYSRQSGRGYGHVTISKEDFVWLKQAVASQLGRPIDFVQLSSAST